MPVEIKRIYDPPSDADGFRVLVDRLWPRGVSKARAVLDLWLKDVAPSPPLRTWFGHQPERFAEFSTRYRLELDRNEAVPKLKQIIKDHQQTTLLYAARDPRVNHAAVLLDYLRHK